MIDGVMIANCYLVWVGGNGSFLMLALAVKLDCPLGKKREMTGVISGTVAVTETVSISCGPPALPAPPSTLEIETVESVAPIEVETDA
jgi:hypothetical protein